MIIGPITVSSQIRAFYMVIILVAVLNLNITG